mgnify:CR=1 FL=1
MSLIRPAGYADRRDINNALARAWIAETIAGDAVAGRSSRDFVVDPEVQVRPHAQALNKRGVRIYAGSGNFFLVDVNGRAPRVLQRRPLAQRYVELVTDA